MTWASRASSLRMTEAPSLMMAMTRRRMTLRRQRPWRSKVPQVPLQQLQWRCRRRQMSQAPLQQSQCRCRRSKMSQTPAPVAADERSKKRRRPSTIENSIQARSHQRW